MIEAGEYEDNTFLTLSYNQESLPEGGTLVPKHLTAFFKALRKVWPEKKVRYYAVGEYGDRS